MTTAAATKTTAAKRTPDCPHIYGYGSRLSNAYTIGRDGLPCPKHAGARGSAGYNAWKRGRDDRAALAKVQS